MGKDRSRITKLLERKKVLETRLKDLKEEIKFKLLDMPEIVFWEKRCMIDRDIEELKFIEDMLGPGEEMESAKWNG